MFTTGTVSKEVSLEKIVYSVGDVKIQSEVPLRDLEENLGRHVVMMAVRAFPLRSKLRLVKQGE